MGNFKERLMFFVKTQYDEGQKAFEERCGLSNGQINKMGNGAISSAMSASRRRRTHGCLRITSSSSKAKRKRAGHIGLPFNVSYRSLLWRSPAVRDIVRAQAHGCQAIKVVPQDFCRICALLFEQFVSSFRCRGCHEDDRGAFLLGRLEVRLDACSLPRSSPTATLVWVFLRPADLSGRLK